MKTIKSFEILKKVGISIRDFEWEHDTEKYMRFISGRKKRTEFLVEFEEELKQYPISCLQNIVHVEGTTADAIAEMQNYAKENLIQSYNNQKDMQLKFKIAHGLGNISSKHFFFIALRDPDLSDQQRNEVWKKVIGKFRKKSYYKQIDIKNLQDTLKASLERSFDEKTGNSTKEVLKRLFRFRVLSKNKVRRFFPNRENIPMVILKWVERMI